MNIEIEDSGFFYKVFITHNYKIYVGSCTKIRYVAEDGSYIAFKAWKENPDPDITKGPYWKPDAQLAKHLQQSPKSHRSELVKYLDCVVGNDP